MLFLPKANQARSVELSRWGACGDDVRMPDKRFGFSLALRDIPDLVGAEIGPSFFLSLKPVNFEAIDLGRGAQTYMEAVAVLGKIRGAADRAAQWNTCNPGDRRCAVAKSQWRAALRNPVVQAKFSPVSLGNVVAKKPHPLAVIDDRDIHRTVMVVVSHGEPAADMRLRKRAIPGRQIVEKIALRIPEQKRWHGHQLPRRSLLLFECAAIGNDQIRPPIRIKIDEACAPADLLQRGLSDPHVRRHVSEVQLGAVGHTVLLR